MTGCMQIVFILTKIINLVVSTNWDTDEINWILGSHENWDIEYERFLLTPVDESGNPLYDFERGSTFISNNA